MKLEPVTLSGGLSGTEHINQLHNLPTDLGLYSVPSCFLALKLMVHSETLARASVSPASLKVAGARLP